MKLKLHSYAVRTSTATSHRTVAPSTPVDLGAWVVRILAVLTVVAGLVAIAVALHGTVLELILAFAVSIALLTATPFAVVRVVSAVLAR